jgi:hypothetical protein
VRVENVGAAETAARSRAGYERARGRIGELELGMKPRAVEAALGAVTAVAGSEDVEGDSATVIDGFLCRVDVDPLRQRWLFGYDDGGVVLIGFAVEFEREDPDDKWRLRRVDRTPSDDCLDVE